MKSTVQIEIAGARYRMSSDADEAYLQRLADIVNERVQALGPKAARAATPAQLLAVVALSLAEDLEVSERHRMSLEDKTRRVMGAAIRRIDERLQADAELAQQIEEP
ncbi:MAG: cell division protein ZapA [Deltaproteobacteria bacterium]|nr:cell division protein ZapA [Deltaproteobacteria bacterium]